MQLRTFREKILYIGSKPREKKMGEIGYGEFDSLRTAGMFHQENLHLRSEDRTYGDKNGNQITMLTIKYLVSIYMFSLKKHPTLFVEEIDELMMLVKLMELEEESEELEFTYELVAILQMKQNDMLSHYSKKTFYLQNINSPVLLYLLYFLVSYGSSDALIKDFDKIASKSEEILFNKARFIFQTSVELYRDDMLLTMLLEPLADTLTPIRLVEIYNNHLNYYNDLLEKDKEVLSPSISGYDSLGTNNRVRNNLSDQIKLFPTEDAYKNVTFPEEILCLDETSKKKILRIIIDLFNLESSYNALFDDIKIRHSHDIPLLNFLYNSLEDRTPEIKTFDFKFTNLESFRIMQEANSLSTKTHLVFNGRIIDLLETLSDYLPDGHPFAYVRRL